MNYNLDISRMNYKMQKKMKKMYGKHTAFQIACAKKMINTMQKLFKKCS